MKATFMNLLKFLFVIIFSLPALLFLSLGLLNVKSIQILLPSLSLREQNTFILLGIFYLIFVFIFFQRRIKKKKFSSYEVFTIFLFIYSIASIPRLLNLTYFAEHYVYLSDSLKNFKLEITPSCYIDDPVIYNGKYYVAFPPFPALLMIPLSLIFKTNFHDFLLQIIFGSLNIALIFTLTERYSETIGVSFSSSYKFWVVSMFGLGTVHLTMLHFEGVWFVAHVVSTTFLLLSIIESLGKKRTFLMGLLWAFSIMTRTHLILAFPYFISSLWEGKFGLSYLSKGKNLKKIVLLFLPVFLILLTMGIYNFLRFGDFVEMGYTKMRLNYPYSEYIKHGQFNIRFLPKNLYYMLVAPPKLTKNFPFFNPDPWGMGLIYCSPIFFVLYRAFKKDKISLFSWLSLALILVPILLYYTTGGGQYGYRFIMDFLPFLALLFNKATMGRLRNYEYALIIFSILVNLRSIFWEFIF